MRDIWYLHSSNVHARFGLVIHKSRGKQAFFFPEIPKFEVTTTDRQYVANADIVDARALQNGARLMYRWCQYGVPFHTIYMKATIGGEMKEVLFQLDNKLPASL